ncbi:MAG: hypothetical protein IPK80_29580 [Nannocystis sp.]|nr:hypothetical protein [Nannocystis sp.]
MIRKHLLTFAPVLSPLLAFGLVLPPTASAAPEGPVASETLVTSQSPPPPQSQTQGPAGLGQDQEAQRQMQQFGGAPGSQTYQGPGFTMSPQIQVQVAPQIQITAHPNATAEANPTSNSSSNGTSTATADVDTVSTSESQSQSQSQSDADSKVSGAPVAVAPVKTTPVTIRVRTRVVPVPSSAAYPIYPYKPPKPRKAMMIAGWTVFGASYLPTAFTGANIYDWCSHNRQGADRESCREIGQMLMIPAIGPFMAINKIESQTEGYYLALTGATQTIGLMMALIGTSRYVRDKKAARLSQHGVRVAKGVHVGAGSVTYQF